MLAGLADKTPLGTVEKANTRTIQVKINTLPTMNHSSPFLDLEQIKNGVEYPYRRCDFLVLKLSDVEGCPKIDLFWPEARRDEAVAASTAFVKRYGGSFAAAPPAGVIDAPERKAHLRFPTLDKPATRDDVAANRAIFSLEGQGEIRLASISGFPQPARWLTLKDVPRVWADQDGTIHREYDTDGYIWQAEEIRKGNHWERFYGFVGYHVVARCRPRRSSSAALMATGQRLKGGIDARVELAEPHKTRFDPARPVLVNLLIRNRLGESRSAPTEFLQKGAEGKPAIRKGVYLVLRRSRPRGPSDGFKTKLSPGAGRGQASRPFRPWRDFTAPGSSRIVRGHADRPQ